MKDEARAKWVGEWIHSLGIKGKREGYERGRVEVGRGVDGDD
jgi:hypothetical protein